MFTGNIDQTTDLVMNGIRSTLASDLEKIMRRDTDAYIKDYARQLAATISARISSANYGDDGVMQLKIFINNEPLDKKS